MWFLAFFKAFIENVGFFGSQSQGYGIFCIGKYLYVLGGQYIM